MFSSRRVCEYLYRFTFSAFHQGSHNHCAGNRHCVHLPLVWLCAGPLWLPGGGLFAVWLFLPPFTFPKAHWLMRDWTENRTCWPRSIPWLIPLAQLRTKYVWLPQYGILSLPTHQVKQLKADMAFVSISDSFDMPQVISTMLVYMAESDSFVDNFSYTCSGTPCDCMYSWCRRRLTFKTL